MNSSIACRYPRFDSGERRLSRTADLLWSRSGRPSFVFGRFSFEDFRLACLLIPAASTAAGQEPMPARRRVGRFTSKWRCQCGCRMLADSSGVISGHAVFEAEVLRTLCKNGCIHASLGEPQAQSPLVPARPANLTVFGKRRSVGGFVAAGEAWAIARRSFPWPAVKRSSAAIDRFRLPQRPMRSPTDTSCRVNTSNIVKEQYCY